jgi:cytochrome P450
LLTDDAYAHRGGLIEAALDDTLWENPPVANLAPHYPAADMEFAGQKVRAGDLMLVSFAAANTGPVLGAARRAGNKAHLAWSAGPHACPSKDPARQITVTALENLLNQLPDVELAVPEDSLTWRPGPFNRGLVALPARFTPGQRARWPAPGEGREASMRVEPGAPAAAKPEKAGRWSQFLNWLTR